MILSLFPDVNRPSPSFLGESPATSRKNQASHMDVTAAPMTLPRRPMRGLGAQIWKRQLRTAVGQKLQFFNVFQPMLRLPTQIPVTPASLIFAAPLLSLLISCEHSHPGKSEGQLEPLTVCFWTTPVLGGIQHMISFVCQISKSNRIHTQIYLYLSICLSIYLSIDLSIHLSIYLSYLSHTI